MVLDPIPQSLSVHFFGSRPQPPTSLYIIIHDDEKHLESTCMILSLWVVFHFTTANPMHDSLLMNVVKWNTIRKERIIHAIRKYSQSHSIKLQVSFANEPYKRDNILQKRPVITSSTANPTWGDIFESSLKAQSTKLKAQSSNVSFHWNVAKETFELWALSFRKWHPKWDWL